MMPMPYRQKRDLENGSKAIKQAASLHIRLQFSQMSRRQLIPIPLLLKSWKFLSATARILDGSAL